MVGETTCFCSWCLNHPNIPGKTGDLWVFPLKKRNLKVWKRADFCRQQSHCLPLGMVMMWQEIGVYLVCYLLFRARENGRLWKWQNVTYVLLGQFSGKQNSIKKECERNGKILRGRREADSHLVQEEWDIQQNKSCLFLILQVGRQNDRFWNGQILQTDVLKWENSSNIWNKIVIVISSVVSWFSGVCRISFRVFYISIVAAQRSSGKAGLHGLCLKLCTLNLITVYQKLAVTLDGH